MTDLGLKKLRFMTNNPKKVAGLEGYGLEIVESVPLSIKSNPHNQKYLQTKVEKMGHILPEDSLQLEETPPEAALHASDENNSEFKTNPAGNEAPQHEQDF